MNWKSNTILHCSNLFGCHHGDQHIEYIGKYLCTLHPSPFHDNSSKTFCSVDLLQVVIQNNYKQNNI